MDGKTIQVLLVEDEEPHAELIRRAFASQAEPVRLTVAATLCEARERLAASVPDLVIADLRLPDGNGLDLLPCSEQERSFPIVVLTAHGDERTAVEAMKRGALDYVVKSEVTLAAMPRIARRTLREWGHIIDRKAAQLALAEAHDQLEQRVQQRTAQLTAANRQLQEEIAERRRVERALRESEERFRLAFENGAVGMAIVDVHHKMLYVNRALCKMLGYTALELVGREVAGLTHSEDRQTSLAVSQRVFSGEIPSGAWESRYLGKDGRIIWGQVTASSVRGSNGEVMYGLAMIKDITARKLAEERAERLREELAHIGRVATMGEMASSIAHELNQPLSAIVMQAEVAAHNIRHGKKPSPQSLLQTLEHLADQGYRAGQIIRRMKDFVKKAEPKRSTVHLADVVEEVMGLLANDLRHADISFACHVERSLPPVLADKIQLQQVLVNLIRNAMETMHSAAPDGRRVRLSATAGNGTVEVAVSDTGRGLPQGDVDRLFETFYSTKPDNLGLGLTICRSIVEAHGGRIWAAANPDRGSTFTFTLPIAQQGSSHGS